MTRHVSGKSDNIAVRKHDNDRHKRGKNAASIGPDHIKDLKQEFTVRQVQVSQ